MRWMTPNQEKVYHFILERQEEGKAPPTIQEIADAVGAKRNLVHRRVVALEKKGYLARDGWGTARNIRVAMRM